LAGDDEQVDVEQEVARRHQRHGTVDDPAMQHLGAALRVAVGQVEQPPDQPGEARRRDPPGAGPAPRGERGGMAATGDDAVDARRLLGQPRQFGGWGGAVGVDEADEVGVAAAEHLHQHAALAELGELVEPDPIVGGGVAEHDVGGVITAAVERDVEAHIGLGEA
jgi:hypothetical protein